MIWMNTHSMIEICCPFMGMVVEKKTLEKTEGAIKNGQSTGHTKHKTKTSKTQKYYKTQKSEYFRLAKWTCILRSIKYNHTVIIRQKLKI